MCMVSNFCSQLKLLVLCCFVRFYDIISLVTLEIESQQNYKHGRLTLWFKYRFPSVGDIQQQLYCLHMSVSRCRAEGFNLICALLPPFCTCDLHKSEMMEGGGWRVKCTLGSAQLPWWGLSVWLNQAMYQWNARFWFRFNEDITRRRESAA